MHIPDGFVNVATAATTYVGSAGAIAWSVHKTKQTLQERFVPLMGVMGAFVFAAQMINFPIAGGTSGHLMGGALVAILLGPSVATLVLTAVLVLQALVFQDGGLLALGANVFNMAVVGVWCGYGCYLAIAKVLKGPRAQWIASFVAAWFSVMIASAFAAAELAISGMSPLGVIMPAMLTVHALIGIGEGLITTAVLAFISTTRSDLVPAMGSQDGGAP